MNKVKFTKTHEWVRHEEDHTGTIGITFHAQELLGDIVFIELPEVGQEVKQGDVFAVVESVKAASDVYAPVSGTITEVNTSLTKDPALLNQDPYGNGWIIKLSLKDQKELENLLQEQEYKDTCDH